MSDTPAGPGWWMADDGKWYAPEQRVGDSTVAPSAGISEPVVGPAAPGMPPAGGRSAKVVALVAVAVIGMLVGLSAALVLLGSDDEDEDDVRVDRQGEVVSPPDDSDVSSESRGQGADSLGDRVDERGDDRATGVVVEGDGWIAIFPGEVERRDESFPVNGYTATSEGLVWESPSEGLGVWVTDFPLAWVQMVESTEGTTLLEFLMGEAGLDIVGSSLLDADGTFRGRDALVGRQSSPDGTAGVTLLIIDGTRTYQVSHGSSDGDTTAWEALVESFEFTDR